MKLTTGGPADDRRNHPHKRRMNVVSGTKLAYVLALTFLIRPTRARGAPLLFSTRI